MEILLAQCFVQDIEAVGVGHEVRNACFGRGTDDLAEDIGGRTGGESDNEKLLALES